MVVKKKLVCLLSILALTLSGVFVITLSGCANKADEIKKDFEASELYKSILPKNNFTKESPYKITKFELTDNGDIEKSGSNFTAIIKNDAFEVNCEGYVKKNNNEIEFTVGKMQTTPLVAPQLTENPQYEETISEAKLDIYRQIVQDATVDLQTGNSDFITYVSIDKEIPVWFGSLRCKGKITLELKNSNFTREGSNEPTHAFWRGIFNVKTTPVFSKEFSGNYQFSKMSEENANAKGLPIEKVNINANSSESIGISFNVPSITATSTRGYGELITESKQIEYTAPINDDFSLSEYGNNLQIDFWTKQEDVVLGEKFPENGWDFDDVFKVRLNLETSINFSADTPNQIIVFFRFSGSEKASFSHESMGEYYAIYTKQ